MLKSEKKGNADPEKNYVYCGRERHSSSRYLNWGYPQRMVRSQDFLLVWNLKPERWPAGAPQRIVKGTDYELRPVDGIDENGVHHSDWAYTDIDAAPTKSFIIENRQDEEIKPYFDLAVAKRPEFEFFNVQKDPFCLVNLAGDPGLSEVEVEMKKVLVNELKKSRDPRVVGPDKEIFDSYLRFSPIREFPDPRK
jgi:uncharacterized sulfatase